MSESKHTPGGAVDGSGKAVKHRWVADCQPDRTERGQHYMDAKRGIRKHDRSSARVPSRSTLCAPKPRAAPMPPDLYEFPLFLGILAIAAFIWIGTPA